MSSADVDTAVPGGPTPTAIPVEERHRALVEDLTARLGDAVLGTHQRTGDLWIRVAPSAWLRAAEELRAMGFDYFCHLSGIDWMPHTWPNPKVIEGPEGAAGAGDEQSPEAAAADDGPPEAEPGFEADEARGDQITSGFAGGDTRFQVLARLYSITRKLGVNLKVDLDDDAPSIQTWTTVYPGADWCEREAWEMYGFNFEGHPNLIHLYLPGEFEGFPLRKDFPLLAREVKPWPGLVDVEPMPEPAEGPEEAGRSGEAEA